MSEYMFPMPVLLHFYRDSSCTPRHYQARLVFDTAETSKACQTAIDGDKYTYMTITADDVILYRGKIDTEAALSCLCDRFDDTMFPIIRCDAYVLDDDFMEKVTRYLNAVKVLVSCDADTEDIIHARDCSYGEEDEVQRCLDAILSIRRI